MEECNKTRGRPRLTYVCVGLWVDTTSPTKWLTKRVYCITKFVGGWWILQCISPTKWLTKRVYCITKFVGGYYQSDKMAHQASVQYYKVCGWILPVRQNGSPSECTVLQSLWVDTTSPTKWLTKRVYCITKFVGGYYQSDKMAHQASVLYYKVCGWILPVRQNGSPSECSVRWMKG
ncbi:hypothetical protein BaRGS_00012713 [Batillaria attramentaria]|uniref:Uncharacterized protein n=1 Tax=Batillaria attramentaria TaxID=370345 RepID=A0ABD0L9E2_9CAEN